jgi:drug/metabolite transporter (DMT)-like permease
MQDHGINRTMGLRDWGLVTALSVTRGGSFFFIPVSAILLGSLFLGEQLAGRQFLGMGLIGAGLAAIDGRLLASPGRR